MKSKVTIKNTAYPRPLQFSDLVEGDYFISPNAHNLLFRVRKTNPRNSHGNNSPTPDYGYAECVNYPGGSYITASDSCFPDGVELVDVEIHITPRKK